MSVNSILFHLTSVEYRLPMAYRIFILEKSFQGDVPSVQTAFAERFPGKVPPSRQAIHALKIFFRETGSVRDAKKNGRPVSVRSPHNRETVAQFYHKNSSTSQFRASYQVQISRTSITTENYERFKAEAVETTISSRTQ